MDAEGSIWRASNGAVKCRYLRIYGKRKMEAAGAAGIEPGANSVLR